MSVFVLTGVTLGLMAGCSSPTGEYPKGQGQEPPEVKEIPTPKTLDPVPGDKSTKE
jgi:hypothetical protein